MSILLFFLNGIKFQDVLAKFNEFCDFEPNPNGAPLGEEPTRHANFIDAGCSGWGNFSSISSRVNCGFTCFSLNDYDPSFEYSRNHLCMRWNPSKDSLVHVVGFGFRDYVLFPTRDFKWDKSQLIAPKIYLIYKDLFAKFRCDEAQLENEHGSILFHWVRSSNYQTVMRPYESGREMTEEEALDWRWRDILPTEEVFPEITAEYEAKYKEMLDLKVDW